ncbi:MAG: tripartite tricarboxylate transporter substrate binding protein, partial [Rhizobiales bacterium]|nr:tripartite tricarboxylate transporter substrate binding protein [Hyphomicrobiales bacterium]
MIRMLNVVAALAAVGLTALFTVDAHAQHYPDQPIRIIVPQGPGGPTDLLARVAGRRLQAASGQNVIVENRGGAGGVIAAKAVGSADPDGYTLLMGNTSVLVLNPILSRTAAYDPTKIFTPVARLAESYQVLVVNASLPVKTVADLVAYAKANPGKLNYASAGIGNTIHLAGELFNHSAGINIVHVPYNSGAEATTAVLGGQVQMTFVNIARLPPLIADGKLRALAVTSPKRLPLLPDTPTMIESGFPDFVVRAFFGIVAPAGTPAPIV